MNKTLCSNPKVAKNRWRWRPVSSKNRFNLDRLKSVPFKSNLSPKFSNYEPSKSTDLNSQRVYNGLGGLSSLVMIVSSARSKPLYGSKLWQKPKAAHSEVLAKPNA